MANTTGSRSASLRPWAGLALAGLLILPPAAAVFGFAPPPGGFDPPLTASVRTELAQDRRVEPWVKAAYAERGFRPLWIEGGRLSPAAKDVAHAIAEARDDALDPAAYDSARLTRAAIGPRASPADLAKADVALTEAFAHYVADLHGDHDRQPIVYADPAVKPALADPRVVVEGAAHARSLRAYVAKALRMNPIYAQLRQALKRDRSAPLRGLVKVSTAPAPEANEAVLRANMDRVRGLPADLGPRYVLVNVAAQTLWYYDHGRAVGSMRVIVGKPTEQTPQMAGLIRYAVARPYWNIPPDLVRDSVAPKVLAQGAAYLEANDMEALSDWTDHARVLDPAEVDWRAVAAGKLELRMRQRPGPKNMMGEVKFMFPNSLGVYLHDTPLKALFQTSPRTHSAGCVRLEHAPQLAAWIMGPAADQLSLPGAPEQPLNLQRPVPVYLLYLTAAPDDRGRLTLSSDVYRRDLLAAATTKASAP